MSRVLGTNRKLASRKVAGHRVWTAGSGRDVVVVHGGPGFDHRYLVAPLESLRDECRLVFYDQLGSTPGAPDCKVTAEELVGQLAAILEGLRVDAGGAPFVLTHSWGSYLAYAYLARADRLELPAAVLLSPLGLTWKRFDAWSGRQFGRFPPADRDRLRTGRPPPDLAFMRALLRYYVADPAEAARIHLSHFDAGAMRAVQGSIPTAYDFTGLGSSLPKRTALVYGKSDALRPDDTAEINDRAAVTVLPDCAHFPQTERQPQVLRVIREALAQP